MIGIKTGRVRHLKVDIDQRYQAAHKRVAVGSGVLVPKLVGRFAGMFFKKPIEIGRFAETEVVADFFGGGGRKSNLPLGFEQQFLMVQLVDTLTRFGLCNDVDAGWFFVKPGRDRS